MSPSSSWLSDIRRTSPSHSACSATPSHRTRRPHKDDLGSLRNQRAQQLDHGDVECLQDNALWDCGAHATPRAGAPLINDVEHQRQAATPDDTAIRPHQRLYG